MYSPSRLGENPGSADFDPDFRTGKPVIGSLEAMKQVFDCYSSGIFVTSISRWRNPPYISSKVADFIVTNTVPLNLSVESKVLAFVWQNVKRGTDASLCDSIPKFRFPVSTSVPLSK